METIANIPGVGPVVANKIKMFFSETHNQTLVHKMLENGITIISPEA